MKSKLICGVLFICILPLSISCSSEKNNGKLSFKETVKLRQYIVQGKGLYLNYCSNCHQKDGSGLKKLIPPLTSKKFIKENRNKLACILKNGMSGKVEINDIIFDETMPANSNLTNLEIAEILTYIGNNWGNDLGIVSTDEVEQSLNRCGSNLH